MSFPSSVEISIFFESVLSLFGLFLESSETDVDDICILITQTIYAFNVILRRCSLKRFYLLVMVIYKQIQPVPHMPWRAILQPAGKVVVKALFCPRCAASSFQPGFFPKGMDVVRHIQPTSLVHLRHRLLKPDAFRKSGSIPR